ncbi:MAG: HDOD domain-containing protein [Campylobacterota bacterium]|nr:HDOD domain-containing protein [Campylobacterota bacterium]
MNSSLLEKISEIPPLPQSVIEIEAMVHDDNKGFSDYKKIIEKDAIITGEILRNVNAPLYGFRREITSLQQAISLFGIGTIRAFVLFAASKDSFRFDLCAYGMSEKDFKNVSIMHTALMLKWIVKKYPSKLMQLGPAAFMVDIGKILIAQELKQQGKDREFSELISNGMSEEEAERQLCGTTTAEVSATIFDHWDFELDLIHIIRYCEHPASAHGMTKELSAYLKVVRVCVNNKGQITDELKTKALALIEEFELDKELFLSAVETVTSEQKL